MSLRLHPSLNALPPPHTFLLQLFISSAVIGFTKSSSLARPAALPLIATCVYSVVSTAEPYMRTRWASLIGAFSFSFLLQYIDLALLSRWCFEDHGPAARTHDLRPKNNSGSREADSEKPEAALDGHVVAPRPQTSQDATYLERLRFGWSSVWAIRHVNTVYETKNVPPFSKEDPAYIPSCWTFVLRKILIAAVCYLILDLLGARPPPKNNAVLFDVALVPVFRRLGSITSSQMTLRVLSTTGFWVSLYCMIQGGHAVLSSIAVAFGLSEVRDWRPVFGSVYDVYTLRNFWGYVFLLSEQNILLKR